MARFIRINGALIQVADSTATGVLDQASDANLSDLDKVSSFVVKSSSGVTFPDSAQASGGALIMSTGCDVAKVCCWGIAVASGGTNITAGTLWLYAHGNLHDYAPRVLASYDFAASGGVNAGAAAAWKIEPCAEVGSGEMISVYANPAIGAFTGTMTLDLRRSVR